MNKNEAQLELTKFQKEINVLYTNLQVNGYLTLHPLQRNQ